MIKSSQYSNDSFGAPELTPLIDIVFIVVVFLLITANTPLLQLPVNIAESQELAVSDVTSPGITVTIAAHKPYWAIDKQSFDGWPAFKSALLKTIAPEQTVTIAADKAAPTQPLLQLLALLNQQKIGNTHIVMEQPGS